MVMKLIWRYLVTLLILSGCAAAPISPSTSVSEWEDIETGTLNRKIQKAYETNNEWASKPEIYVFKLFDMSDIKKITYEYEANRVEAPTNITIVVVRDGFTDDSVRGDIQQLTLIRNQNGRWELLKLRKAISCWRRVNPRFSSKACP